MSDNELLALGICFEEYAYPHPVRFVPVQNDLQTLAMAYMDVPPESESNGKTVVLMHGKAFGGYYFEQGHRGADRSRVPGGRAGPDRLG